MFGCPVILNVLPGTGIETRNAVPVDVWQSVQWQTCTFSGSASPSILMAPQEHPPSIFMTSLPSFIGCLFEAFHVGIRQAEMMADLVHQHVLYDGAQGLVVLGPVIEDRPPVQPDHIRHLHGGAFAAERKAHSLAQAEQVELGLGLHPAEDFLAREVVDLNDQTGT